MIRSLINPLIDIFRDGAVNGWLASSWIPIRVRSLALSSLSRACIGRDVAIRSQVHLWGPLRNLTVRDGAFINNGCNIGLSNRVTIGAGAAIGARTVIATVTHEMGHSKRRAGTVVTAPVTIGEGAWIGAGCTILPGSVIGRGAVVAAGALVKEPCDDNCLYAGVPARLIRRL